MNGDTSCVDTDANGLEVLPSEECLRLLRSRSLGRLGLSVDALPTILPVSYAVLGDEIIIRTGRGTKLSVATRDAVVAFEVDEIDPATALGWSVVVQGRAREVMGSPALDDDGDARLDRWLDGSERHRHVAVSIDLISGRQAIAAVPMERAAGAPAAQCRT